MQRTDLMIAPYHHAFPLGCIELYVSLVVSAAVSLRGAAQAIEIMMAQVVQLAQLEGSYIPGIPAEQGHGGYACPAWTTGRMWLLRVGYYQLMRPKTQADDWVWIVDHTVQIGQDKCLVILGVRLSALPHEECSLSHAAMAPRRATLEPLALIPVRQSNGQIVCEQLEATVQKTGVPREILSDHGTDLQAGIERFCQRHPQTVSVYDIKHKTAAVLKHTLERDQYWQVFTQRANQAGRQMQQTPLAALLPPGQKSKARYLNVHELVTWGRAVLTLVDQPALHQEHGLDGLAPEQVQAKLGWLTEFRPHLEEWGDLFEIVSVTESWIRHHGIHAGTQQELMTHLRGLAQTPRTRQVRQELLDFVAQEEAKVHPNERLLGSSEIIESVLGKQKRLEQYQSKSGFTGLILGVCAMVANMTREVIRQALETVSTKQVLDWCREMLGSSVQSQRRAVFSALSESE